MKYKLNFRHSLSIKYYYLIILVSLVPRLTYIWNFKSCSALTPDEKGYLSAIFDPFGSPAKDLYFGNTSKYFIQIYYYLPRLLLQNGNLEITQVRLFNLTLVYSIIFYIIFSKNMGIQKNRRNGICLFIILFNPGFIIWSSSVLKEPILFFGSGLILISIWNLYKKKAISYFILLVLGFLITYEIKRIYFYIVVLSLLFGWLYLKIKLPKLHLVFILVGITLIQIEIFPFKILTPPSNVGTQVYSSDVPAGSKIVEQVQLCAKNENQILIDKISKLVTNSKPTQLYFAGKSPTTPQDAIFIGNPIRSLFEYLFIPIDLLEKNKIKFFIFIIDLLFIFAFKL